MQQSGIIAGITTCNYSSVLHATVAHETTALVKKGEYILSAQTVDKQY